MEKTENIGETLPMIALRGKVIFPKTFVNFDVGRPMSVRAAEQALENGGKIFVAAQKNALQDNPRKGDIYRCGVVARITQITKLPAGGKS